MANKYDSSKKRSVPKLEFPIQLPEITENTSVSLFPSFIKNYINRRGFNERDIEMLLDGANSLDYLSNMLYHALSNSNRDNIPKELLSVLDRSTSFLFNSIYLPSHLSSTLYLKCPFDRGLLDMFRGTTDFKVIPFFELRYLFGYGEEDLIALDSPWEKFAEGIYEKIRQDNPRLPEITEFTHRPALVQRIRERTRKRASTVQNPFNIVREMGTIS